MQSKHAVLPETTHDELSRQEFCGTMRKFFTETLWPGVREVYAGSQAPAYERQHGHAPKSVREVKALMEESFYYRAANLLGRTTQEMLWDTVGESVERQLPELKEKAKAIEGRLGSLELHPEMQIPRYVDAVDIHVMPGNFHTELGPDDVYAGALYDRGVYYFAYGGMGPQNDKLGVAMARYVREAFPDFQPKRILDMGCGPGFSTLPWKDAFPDAEVYGVDVGAPTLRYAHARAESMGKAVHFSQQNASETDFEDGFFDLVTSYLLTHEMPVPVIRQTFKESYRLLAPGGLMITDGPTPSPTEPDQELFSGWFNNNNNEPFTVGFKRLNLEDTLVEAGFKREGYFESGGRPPIYLKGMGRSASGASSPISYIGAIKL